MIEVIYNVVTRETSTVEITAEEAPEPPIEPSLEERVSRLEEVVLS